LDQVFQALVRVVILQIPIAVGRKNKREIRIDRAFFGELVLVQMEWDNKLLINAFPETQNSAQPHNHPESQAVVSRQ